MNITKLNAILKATRATEFDALPFLMGDMSLEQWTTSIEGKLVTTKSGKVVTALSSAVWHVNAQRALNSVSLAMKIAVATKELPWFKAAGIANKAHKRMELLLAGIAAHEGKSSELLFPLADIFVATQEGDFSDFQSSGDIVTEEEMHEIGMSWEEIEDALEEQEAARGMQHKGEGDDQMPSAQEGWYKTTLHQVSQLADLPLNKLQFGEWVAAKALVSTIAWPTCPTWDAFLDRVAIGWEARVEYSTDPESELAKIAKRELDIEDISAKPMHVRWTTNHLARRAWRDIQVLKESVIYYTGKVDELIQLDYLEERYGPDSVEFTAQLGRANLGEADTQTRKAWFAGYAELDESTVGHANLSEITQAKYAGNREFGETETAVGYAFVVPDYRVTDEGIEIRARHSRTEVIGRGQMVHDLHGNEFELGARTRQVEESDLEHSSPFQKSLAWFTACVEKAEWALGVATKMHKHLRSMDTALASLWEISLEDKANELNMPTQPPVYWNMEGWYLTEDEAQVALAKELNDAKNTNALKKEAAILASVAGLSSHELMN